MYKFDAILKFTNLALLLSGININDAKWHPIIEFYVNNCLFYFNFLWLYTDVLAEFFWLLEGIQAGKSILELSMIAPCTTVCLLATIKSSPIYFRKTILNDIVDKLKHLHKEIEEYDDISDEKVNDNVIVLIDDETKNIEEEKHIVRESIILLKSVMLLLLISAVLVVALFCFMPITLMAFDYYKNGRYDVSFPFLVKYFFDPFTEVWPYVYFHQVVSTFIVWVNVYGPDTFFYAFCVYVQIHFRILSQRLRKLFYKQSLLLEDKEKFYKLLKRHQELIQLVKDFETLYTSSNLWNMVISSILICLCAFNATTNPDASAVLTFICFLFMSLSQISILCFFGDMIVNSSALVAEAAYSCGWYNIDTDVKKSLRIVIMRAHTPCKLTAANFAVLNLRAFAMIISKSWSYFALLKTLYK